MTTTNDASITDSPTADWNIADIKRKISEWAYQGKLSIELIETLCRNGQCAPIEFELLDYKERFDDSPYEKGKLVKRVVSFFNTYGGYIVFGVREAEPEVRFDVIGFDIKTLDVESLKAKIKEYTGERIQISLQSFDLIQVGGASLQLSFLHIPKRPASNPPLHFVKNGPGDDKRAQPIFFKDDVYHRRGDECIEAKGPRILELNGIRNNPYLEQDQTKRTEFFRVNRIAHNLPDRNFICAKFIGRDSTINNLWRWLGDDLSYVRVLAGEGGLGKSSIAFEFAERVSETPNVPFEQVIWLTAKEQQFIAIEDKFVKVPDRHYTSYEELLRAVCERLPYMPDEIAGATINELRRLVRTGLSQVPSLLIVDDVDSLSAEEQRQVLELGIILGGSSSRLLLTTRFNQSYSGDLVVTLSGLSSGQEFTDFLVALKERLSFPPLSASDISKIHSVSGGSPLFTESILRLLRWHSVGEAISMWKGERGAAVRAAALRREIELLSPESQRILLTIAILGEASSVELCEVLGYLSDKVEMGLGQLQSLFLVAAPALASINRYRVPENTRRLILDKNVSLVTDKVRLEKDIADFRRKSERGSSRDARVASAISQASSLVRVGDIGSAFATIKDARTKTKDHYDLICYQATLHLKESPSRFNEARVLAKKAYEKGCRKPEVFECWFESEWLADHYVGALEATEAALENKSPGASDWLVRKSASLASKATDQAKDVATGPAVSTMFEASEVLRDVISRSRRDDAVEWEKRQIEFHDQIWIWTGMEERGLARTVVQFDAIEKMWKLGDTRITNLRRVLSAIDGMVVLIDKKLDHLSATQRNLAESQIARGQEYFRLRHERFPEDSRHKSLDFSWELLRNKAYDAIHRREVKSKPHN